LIRPAVPAALSRSSYNGIILADPQRQLHFKTGSPLRADTVEKVSD
jgi:hypothetical protein